MAKILPEANPATKHLNKNKEDYWCINSLKRVWKGGAGTDLAFLLLLPSGASVTAITNIVFFLASSLRASSPGHSGGGAGKGKRACNYVSGILIPPPITLRLPVDCQISANQREAETSANVNKHWKIRAKGNDAITSVISAKQHFASLFSMQIIKFQRRSCKISFLFPPHRQSAPESLLVG